MKYAMALFATISWVGCAADSAMTTPGGGNPGDPGDGPGTVTEVSGHITTATTWMHTIHATGDVIVDKGVTLTIAAGTTVDFGADMTLTVSGKVDIQGTSASKVVFRALTSGTFFGTSVPSGGVITASWLVMTSGSLDIVNSGNVTLVDSQMSHYGGDLLTMSSGVLTMSYSQIGLELGQHDTTHCNLHVSGAPVIKLTHSNIGGAAFGIMFYGGSSEDFTSNNWFTNGKDVALEAGPVVSGNFSNSWFASGAPSGAGLSVTNMANARLTTAGVGAPR
jgi:hypothetical protein